MEVNKLKPPDNESFILDAQLINDTEMITQLKKKCLFH